MLIYHIVLPEVWSDARSNAEYSAPSLESEGFIHCSYEHQLETVLSRYYASIKNVVILEIDTEKLRTRFVQEPSTNDEIYPHIYGAVNIDAIVSVETKEL